MSTLQSTNDAGTVGRLAFDLLHSPERVSIVPESVTIAPWFQHETDEGDRLRGTECQFTIRGSDRAVSAVIHAFVSQREGDTGTHFEGPLRVRLAVGTRRGEYEGNIAEQLFDLVQGHHAHARFRAYLAVVDHYAALLENDEEGLLLTGGSDRINSGGFEFTSHLRNRESHPRVEALVAYGGQESLIVRLPQELSAGIRQRMAEVSAMILPVEDTPSAGNQGIEASPEHSVTLGFLPQAVLLAVESSAVGADKELMADLNRLSEPELLVLAAMMNIPDLFNPVMLRALINAIDVAAEIHQTTPQEYHPYYCALVRDCFSSLFRIPVELDSPNFEHLARIVRVLSSRPIHEMSELISSMGWFSPNRLENPFEFVNAQFGPEKVNQKSLSIVVRLLGYLTPTRCQESDRQCVSSWLSQLLAPVRGEIAISDIAPPTEALERYIYDLSAGGEVDGIPELIAALSEPCALESSSAEEQTWLYDWRDSLLGFYEEEVGENIAVMVIFDFIGPHPDVASGSWFSASNLSSDVGRVTRRVAEGDGAALGVLWDALEEAGVTDALVSAYCNAKHHPRATHQWLTDILLGRVSRKTS